MTFISCLYHPVGKINKTNVHKTPWESNPATFFFMWILWGQNAPVRGRDEADEW